MARTPASIGKYKVDSLIAKGGMGAVYKAQHPTLGRPVTIKRLTLRGNASIRERFKREATIMMDFRSDYIVDVYDHFREGSSYYIVQEWVDGLSLEELLERERYLSTEFALLIFRDCCRALKYAHDRNVVHRDIKPGNILISRSGQVELVDFGIASIRGDEESALTREGTTLGTPTYMAPEQLDSTRSVDKRGDIYSLGVMFYEMVTGKKPFPNSISAETVRLIQKGIYRRPRQVNPKVTRWEQRLIRRCMKPKRKRRYQDLQHVIGKLRRRLPTRSRQEELSRIRRYLAGEELVPLGRRARRLRRAVAWAVLLLALGGLGYYGYDAGYHYSLLWPEQYGAVRLGARVHKEAAAGQDISVRAQILRTGAEEAAAAAGNADGAGNAAAAESAAVARSSADFRLNPDAETADYLVLDSRPVVLPVGAYRAKIEVEQTLYWQSFIVRPFSGRLELPWEPAARRVEVTHEPVRELPLALEVELYDRLSGAELSGELSRIAVRQDGAWLPYRRSATDDSLHTGGTVRVRVTRPGYYREEFQVAVEPWQTTLRLSAGMVPRAGTVRIESEAAGHELLLDGRRRYLAGGPEPEYRALQPTSEGETALELPPGSYRLGARGEDETAHISLTVRSDAVTTVRLRTDESGALRFEQGEE